MKLITLSEVVLCLYSGMLRLYPPQFRAEYADEMRDVFEQTLADNENTLSLIGLLLAEVRDLPLTALREHWREQQIRPVLYEQESRLMQRLYSSYLLRFSAVAILLLCGLYGFSVVSAYFAFDMHIHSLQNSQDWWYDYDNNPAFIGRKFPIGLLVFGVYMLIMPTIIVFGGLLTLNILGGWRRLVWHERRLALLALAAALLILMSLNTPIVFIGGLWFYD